MNEQLKRLAERMDRDLKKFEKNLSLIYSFIYQEGQIELIKEFEKRFVKKTKLKMSNLNNEEYIPVLITKKDWKKFKEEVTRK